MTQPVRIEYSGPAGCPTEASFLSEVRARIGTAWEAPAGATARPLVVRLSRSETRSEATLEFFDVNGRHAQRHLEAETCDAVASGAALIAALAIDAQALEPTLDSSGSPTRAENGATGANAGDTNTTSGEGPEVNGAGRSPSNTAPTQSVLPARASPAESSVGSAGSTRAPDVYVGASAELASGVGPAAALGGSVWGGLAWGAGPDFRLGVEYLGTGEVERAGTRAAFSLTGARLLGCPVSIERAAARFLPCVGLAIGGHHGETTRTAAVAAGADTPLYAIPVAKALGQIRLGSVFLEVGAEARFPLDHRDFRIDEQTPGGGIRVYRVPPVAFGLSVGLGLFL